jgi:hypothetical protein
MFINTTSFQILNLFPSSGEQDMRENLLRPIGTANFKPGYNSHFSKQKNITISKNVC